MLQQLPEVNVTHLELIELMRAPDYVNKNAIDLQCNAQAKFEINNREITNLTDPKTAFAACFDYAHPVRPTTNGNGSILGLSFSNLE